MFQQFVGVVIGIILIPVILFLAGTLLILQGRPVFVRLERMNGPRTTFQLVKFRTLPVDKSTKAGVANRDKLEKVTAIGRFMRRSRLDEFPQIWNVIMGDIGFIGPRPPDPCHVAAFPELFGPVLSMRPGVTGLGTVIFSAYERRIIGRLGPDRAEMVYRDRILPRKIALERMFLCKRGPRLNVYILYLTIARVLPIPGCRARRLRRLGQTEGTQKIKPIRQPPPDRIHPDLSRIHSASVSQCCETRRLSFVSVPKQPIGTSMILQK